MLLNLFHIVLWTCARSQQEPQPQRFLAAKYICVEIYNWRCCVGPWRDVLIPRASHSTDWGHAALALCRSPFSLEAVIPSNNSPFSPGPWLSVTINASCLAIRFPDAMASNGVDIFPPRARRRSLYPDEQRVWLNYCPLSSDVLCPNMKVQPDRFKPDSSSYGLEEVPGMCKLHAGFTFYSIQIWYMWRSLFYRQRFRQFSLYLLYFNGNWFYSWLERWEVLLSLNIHVLHYFTMPL